MKGDPDAQPDPGLSRRDFAAGSYDLRLTLDCGQAFRWREQPGGSWEGVVEHRWVRLRQEGDRLVATSPHPSDDWNWLTGYLRLGEDLQRIESELPRDPVLGRAWKECRGLHLLRQDPWECLASFILSSTKQIPQIRQCIERICRQWGEPLPHPSSGCTWHDFPTPQRLARVSESDLRRCRIGFRAPYLLEAAQRVADGRLRLEPLSEMSLDQARCALEELPGVGRKIADCVLLFSCGHDAAFPIDVWVARALSDGYFQGRPTRTSVLQVFAGTHFGPRAGWAQQYLFHSARRGGCGSGSLNSS